MRKSVLLSVMVLCLLLLAGCGGKSTLKCKTTSSGVDVNLNVNFDGNKIEKMDLKYFMDLADYSDDQIDILKDTEFCPKVKAVMGDFKEAFSNCKQNIEDKKLNVTADFDLDKIDSKKLSKMQNPEDAKKDLESVGYTCSIEK